VTYRAQLKTGEWVCIPDEAVADTFAFMGRRWIVHKALASLLGITLPHIIFRGWDWTVSDVATGLNIHHHGEATESPDVAVWYALLMLTAAGPARLRRAVRRARKSMGASRD